MLALVWANLQRRPWRFLFTVSSIVIAFAMFGLLEALRQSLAQTVSLAGADRLITTHKLSIINPLPRAYFEKVKTVEGVTRVAPFNWFGGVYKDGRAQIPVYPTEVEDFLKMYPEVRMPENDRQAWLADRQGVAIGPILANQFNWKVGDRIPLRSTIYRKQDGGDTWEFNVRAIYDVIDSTGWDKGSVVFHYDYFNESLRGGRDSIGWMMVKVADPARSEDVARRVDAMFVNSAAETKTATERAFIKQTTEQIGNIGAILVSVVSAVFFTMLLVTANTMAQSVRERTNEIGVLKTLGFSNGSILALVLAEALTLTLLGGLIGLAIATGLVAGMGAAVKQIFPVFEMSTATVLAAIGLMLLLGLVSGAWPAATAMRLKIVDALQRS
jgi:putative ABC transport system permease protein